LSGYQSVYIPARLRPEASISAITSAVKALMPACCVLRQQSTHEKYASCNQSTRTCWRWSQVV